MKKELQLLKGKKKERGQKKRGKLLLQLELVQMLGANHLLQEGMTQLPHSLSLALRLNQIRLLQIHQGAIAVRLQTLHQQARFLLLQQYQGHLELLQI